MVNSKTSYLKTGLETMQWLIFLLANSIALPIVMASIFQMDFQELAGLMQRTFFVVGIASVLQGWLGHRLPVMEGPAGLWISIFSVMAVTGTRQGMNSMETLQTLQTAMLFAGAFLLIFGVFRIAEKTLPLFTSLVTGTFIFLLTVQLIGTFLKGMLGIQEETEAIQSTEALLAFFTFSLVLGLSIFGRDWISNYAVLIGILSGWMIYRRRNRRFRRFPVVFGTGAAGVGNAGFLSAINVPLATSTGFIRLTSQKRKAPFIYASFFLVAVSSSRL